MSGLRIETFGCRLNLAESEAMRRLAAEAGIADAIIVHSCAVTGDAERQARQAVGRAGRDHPEAPVIVAGCAATLRPDAFAGMPGVVGVLANDAKLDPASWRAIAAALPPQPAAAAAPRTTTRGFVAVQRGCDHRCTFCIIPYARGPHRSEPAGSVAAEARRLVAAGCREIVLTGVDVTAWGSDLPGRPGLGDLVRGVLAAAPELPRLRLSSLDPAEIDPTLWHLLADEPRLMPHLHLSLQAGDDLVLKQMKRRHRAASALEAAIRAREARPGLALGADLIAGFPTESDAQFERSLALVEAAGIDYLHVFPYSPRRGTPAARLRPLPGSVVAERAKRLRQLGTERLRRRLDSLVGRTAAVLVERGGAGHAECFARVRPARPAAPGELVRVRLAAVAGDHLIGEAA